MSQQDGQEEKQEEEQQPMAQPVFPDRGPDREQMAANYLPDSDDWVAKTMLELNDPAALAALSIMGDLYPEVDDLQAPIDEHLSVFLRARTSIAKASREEYERIIMSMYGGSPEDKGSGAIKDLLAADLDEE